MVKPLSRRMSPAGYKPPTMVEILGFNPPTPRIISAKPVKKAQSCGIAKIPCPSTSNPPPIITVLFCPKNLSATQPPGIDATYTNIVYHPYSHSASLVLQPIPGSAAAVDATK